MVTLTIKKTSSVLEKTLGLIGKKKIEPLYFETRFGIHTFGVKEPIDVIILDETSHIVALKENLKPNRIFLWNPKYKRVVELPKETVQKYNLKPDGELYINLLKSNQ